MGYFEAMEQELDMLVSANIQVSLASRVKGEADSRPEAREGDKATGQQEFGREEERRRNSSACWMISNPGCCCLKAEKKDKREGGNTSRATSS